MSGEIGSIRENTPTFETFISQVFRVNESLPGALSVHDPQQLAAMQGVYLSTDHLQGYVISDDNELGSVFNLGTTGKGGAGCCIRHRERCDTSELLRAFVGLLSTFWLR